MLLLFFGDEIATPVVTAEPVQRYGWLRQIATGSWSAGAGNGGGSWMNSTVGADNWSANDSPGGGSWTKAQRGNSTW